MKPAPLLIVGLDAGDPDSILQWALDGRLPVIGSLLQQGSWGRLLGPEMISVHSVWLTFFSGVSLRRHGYYMSRQLVPGTYRLQSLHPSSAGAPAFWSDLKDRNLQCLILDVPDVDLVPGLPGYQLANWGVHNTSEPCRTLPAELLEDLRDISCPPMTTHEKQGSHSMDRRILKHILQRVERKGKLCRYLWNRNACDLSVVVFGDSHAASHRFRKYLGTEDELAGAILAAYQAIDREIGLFLQACSEPPNVFVVSNSGINDGYPIGSLMESFMCQLGYQRMKAAGSRYLRTWRELAEHYLPGSRRSRSQVARFGKGVDWKRTTAFALPGYYTGYVRINLSGREPEGIVAPGSEYHEMLARLEADFLQLVDEETREPVVESVMRTASLFGGNPPAQLPDLFIKWRPCTRLSRRIVHPGAVLVRKKHADPRGNYHSTTGLVIAAGPHLSSRGSTGDFSPADFATLFRVLLGQTEDLSLLSPALKGLVA